MEKEYESLSLHSDSEKSWWKVLEFLDLHFHTSLDQASKLYTMNIVAPDWKAGGKVKRQLLTWRS